MPEMINHDGGQSHETRMTVKYEGVPQNLNQPPQLPKWVNFILWLTEKAKEYGVALSLAVKAPSRFLEAKLQEAEKPANENKKTQAETLKIAEETATIAMERQAKFAILQQELTEKERQANLEALQKISELLSNPKEDVGILESKFEILEEAYPHIRAQIKQIKDRQIKLLVKGVKITMNISDAVESLPQEEKVSK